MKVHPRKHSKHHFLAFSGYTFQWLWVLIPFALFSCALPQTRSRPPAVQTHEQAHARTFPDFAAVLVQPGDTLSSLAGKYLHDPSKGWFIGEFNGVSRIRPGQAIVIPFKPYDRGGLSLRGYQTVPVLCYHRFSKSRVDRMTVREKDFEDQMEFLRDHGYHVITLDQLLAFMDFKGQIPPKSVVITIDDGWRSLYDIAYPILKRFGYPATLFVYTNLITGSYETLSWNQIRIMYQNGIDMQCHTKTHRSLHWKRGEETFEHYFRAVQNELTESAKVLKEELNDNVKYFAYPYGDTNDLVIEALKKLRYKEAFTVKRGANPFFVDAYRIDRSMIYGEFTLRDFQENLKVFEPFN